MPVLRYSCPNCQHIHAVPPHLIGKRVRCSKCSAIIAVRNPSEQTTVASAPTPPPPSKLERLLLWPLLLGGAGVLALCCGGATCGGLLWWDLRTAPTTGHRLAAAKEGEREKPPEKPADDPKKPANEPKAAPAIAFKVSMDLWRAYGDNEAAADLKYTGKTIEFLLINGKVKRGPDGYYIAGGLVQSVALPQLGLPAPPQPTEPCLPCYLRPSAVNKAANAKSSPGIDPTFRLRGRCEGKRPTPGAFKGYSVVLKDCEILAVLTWDAATKTWRED